MYASKLLNQKVSPVAKWVMIAEANTDAPKSFCDAPDGTGHRDMGRSKRSGGNLEDLSCASRGQESDGAVVAVKRVMTVERRVPACMAFQTETAERGWPMWLTTRKKKGESHVSRKRQWSGAMHRARPGRNSRRKPMRVRGCAPVKSPKVKFGWKAVSVRKCADDGLAEAGERRRPARTNSWNSELTQKNLL